MNAPPRRASGFTLIELMIVVAIIGILSTVALPAFQKVTLRTRTAERRTIMNAIKHAADDFYLQKGRLVDESGASIEGLEGAFNPSVGAPGPTKRPFNVSMAGWRQILPPKNMFLEGNLYYSYRFILVDSPPLRTLTVQARGDLDGDGVASDTVDFYRLDAGAFRLDPSASTAPGTEDATTF